MTGGVNRGYATKKSSGNTPTTYPDPNNFPYAKFLNLGYYLAGRWEGDGGVDNLKLGTETVPKVCITGHTKE